MASANLKPHETCGIRAQYHRYQGTHYVCLGDWLCGHLEKTAKWPPQWRFCSHLRWQLSLESAHILIGLTRLGWHPSAKWEKTYYPKTQSPH